MPVAGGDDNTAVGLGNVENRQRGVGTHYQPDDFYIDLFSAETCHAVAEILALVGDKIEPIITVRGHRLIEERCFAVLDKPFWWKKATHNWSAVCAGEVGMTAIYVKKDPDELAKIIYCFRASGLSWKEKEIWRILPIFFSRSASSSKPRGTMISSNSF